MPIDDEIDAADSRRAFQNSSVPYGAPLTIIVKVSKFSPHKSIRHKFMRFLLEHARALENVFVLKITV